MSSAPTGFTTPVTNRVTGHVPTIHDFNVPEANTNAIELGNRTLDQALAGRANVGTLRQFLSWFAGLFRAITGATNWFDAPATNLATANTHITAAAPHTGHETPVGAQSRVDTHAGLTTGTHGVGTSTVESVAGAQSKVDTHAALTTAHGSSVTATANSIVQRNAAGEVFGTDVMWGTRRTITLPANTDLNNVVTSGWYVVASALNRPTGISGWAHLNVIAHVNDMWNVQIIYDFNDADNIFTRQSFDSANVRMWTPWRRMWHEANLPVTSGALPHTAIHRDANARAQVADGVAPLEIANRGQLDTHAGLTTAHSAVSAPTASRIIVRDAAGRAQVADGAVAADIVNRRQAVIWSMIL